MSTHDITLAGYVVIALCGATLEALARRVNNPIPRWDTMIRWALRTRSGRIGIFAVWAWMGLHFLG